MPSMARASTDTFGDSRNRPWATGFLHVSPPAEEGQERIPRLQPVAHAGEPRIMRFMLKFPMRQGTLEDPFRKTPSWRQKCTTPKLRMMTVRYPRGLSGLAGRFLEVFLKESKAAPIRKEEHKCETATGLHKTKDESGQDIKEKEYGGGALSEAAHIPQLCPCLVSLRLLTVSS